MASGETKTSSTTPMGRGEYPDIEIAVGNETFTARGLQIIKSGGAILHLLPRLNGQPLTRSYAVGSERFCPNLNIITSRRNAFGAGIKNLLSNLVIPTDQQLVEKDGYAACTHYVVTEPFEVNGQLVRPTDPEMVQDLFKSIDAARRRAGRIIRKPQPEPTERIIPIPEIGEVMSLRPGDPLPLPKDLDLGQMAYYVYSSELGQEMDPMDFDQWRVITASGTFYRQGEEVLGSEF